MVRRRLLLWLMFMVVLLLIVLGTSACYKNAGENALPTVKSTASLTPPSAPESPGGALSDSSDGASAAQPVDAAQPPAKETLPPAAVQPPSPTTGAQESPPERTLVPTTTPATPTVDPLSQPTFTPTTDPASVIVTPGLNDVMPTFTPAFAGGESTLQPTPTGVPTEENPCVYVVQPNDTLYSIATERELTVDELRAVNISLIGNTDLIQPGWELQIPGCESEEGAEGEDTPETITVEGTEPGDETAADALPDGKRKHIVQSGDTVFSIATQYGVSVDSIVEANRLTVIGDTVIIHEGQELVIPPPETSE